VSAKPTEGACIFSTANLHTVITGLEPVIHAMTTPLAPRRQDCRDGMAWIAGLIP
jgi:hypothetical protein